MKLVKEVSNKKNIMLCNIEYNEIYYKLYKILTAVTRIQSSPFIYGFTFHGFHYS